MWSQKHGKIYESRIQKEIFKLTDDQIQQWSHTSHYDINKENNDFEKCSSYNISIKSSKSQSIDCGDILRFLNSEETKLICVKFEQCNNFKIAKETICFDLKDYFSLLERDVNLLMNESYNTWLKKVEEYVRYIHNIYNF